MANNYYRAMMIQENNRKRWLKVNPRLPERSGIYVITRVDENGLKYAYIGQAKKILTRLAQHLAGYQHIDLSLKKHKLYNKDKNPYGWDVDYCECLESELDALEKYYILQYAISGYQLRNKTAGGQDKGKVGIDDNKASKGYRDGLKQGYKNAIRDIKEYFDKYLVFLPIRNDTTLKKNGDLKEIVRKKYSDFRELLEGKENDANE